MCTLQLSSTSASYGYRLTTVVLGFHCDVISCQLARRNVRRGAAEESSACGRRTITQLPVGLTSKICLCPTASSSCTNRPINRTLDSANVWIPPTRLVAVATTLEGS